MDGRDVPATVMDPLATFGGTVDAPHQPAWVQMQVQTTDRVLLAFETEPAAGSSFQAGPLNVFEGEGVRSKVLGPAGAHGFSLGTVRSGIVFARVAAAGSSTGAFDVAVTLAGDINGDHQVDARDLDVIRSLKGVRAGDAGYLPAADVNHNGVIGLGDLQLAERNLGRSAVVGDVTASQFLFAGSGPRVSSFNPTKMSGISLVIDQINDDNTPIDVTSFGWAVEHPAGGSPTRYDLQVTAPTSVASPRLFQAAAAGTALTDAELYVGQVGHGASAQPRLEFDLGSHIGHSVFVTSYQIVGTQDHGTHLQDQFSLSFDTLTVKYTPTRPNGSAGGTVTASFDFASG